MEEITEKVKCPICFEIPIAEVYQCKNGHTLCSNCSARVANCPTCRVRFESPKARNRVAEDILDILRFDCVYKQYGCNIKVSRKEISKHPETCPFGGKRINLCRLLGYSCDYLTWERGLKLAEDHFIEMHSVQRCSEIEFDIELQGLINCDSGETPSFAAPILLLEQKSIFDRESFLLHTGYNQAEKSVKINLVQMSSIRESLNQDKRSKKLEIRAENDKESYYYTLKFVIKSSNPKEIPDISLTAQPLMIEHAEFGVKYLSSRIPHVALLQLAINRKVVITCSIQRKPRTRTETKARKLFVCNSDSDEIEDQWFGLFD